MSTLKKIYYHLYQMIKFQNIKSFNWNSTSVRFLYLSIFISFLIVACGNGSDKKSSSLNSEILDKEAPNRVSSNNCLEQFHGKPENLITKDLVNKYIDFEGSEVKITTLAEALDFKKAFPSNKSKGNDEKNEKSELSSAYIDMADVSYKWYVNKQRRKVRFGSISKIKLYKSKTPVDRFYAKYHTRTPEEQAELKKLYDSLVLNSDPVKQKTDKSNAEMLSNAVGFNFAYLNIDGIGDAAVWEYKVNDLIVLVGDYQFTVNVDLNKGNDYDLEKAKLIAKAVIAKACK